MNLVSANFFWVMGRNSQLHLIFATSIRVDKHTPGLNGTCGVVLKLYEMTLTKTVYDQLKRIEQLRKQTNTILNKQTTLRRPALLPKSSEMLSALSKHGSSKNCDASPESNAEKKITKSPNNFQRKSTIQRRGSIAIQQGLASAQRMAKIIQEKNA